MYRILKNSSHILQMMVLIRATGQAANKPKPAKCVRRAARGCRACVRALAYGAICVKLQFLRKVVIIQSKD